MFDRKVIAQLWCYDGIHVRPLLVNAINGGIDRRGGGTSLSGSVYSPNSFSIFLMTSVFTVEYSDLS